MRILVAHPSFQVFGGAERVSLRIADILQGSGRCDVVLASAAPPAADLVRGYLGREPGFEIIRAGRPPSFSEPDLVSISRFHRACKAWAKGADLCISGYNEQDFGVPSIQYLHHPLFVSRRILARYEITAPTSALSRHAGLDRIYRGLLDRWAGRDWSRVLSNRTLANSEFMASILRECGFSDVDVLHPGFLLLSPIPATPSERKRQVVFLGRFERDKRVLETIRLMESLHARCQGLDFVLCGARGSERDFNEITETLSKASAPIRMVVHPDRASIDNLLRESMFYINAKPFEHFGMATVEAMDAGCIPLLHHSGSHPEIIGGEDLLFRNAEDLAAIVERLLADPVEAARVQSAMRTSVERFRLDVFSDRLKEIVFGG